MAKANDDADTIDGVDMALALAHGSDEARALIEKQSRLIDAQETLARADLRHRGWQIIGERVASLIKALLALLGILLVLGIASFLWSAQRASGMVLDAFSVPPTFAQQGMSGTIVAQELLDKVVALEAATRSARAKSSYDNSFSDSKGVVVPYAGVSLGELRREARDWLGSETHLSGEVVQLPGSRLAMSFRTTTGLSGRVVGPAADPDALLDQAALAMFKATQPYRYSVYQSRRGDAAESVATLRELARSSDLREKLWAMHGLALGAQSRAETVAIYRQLLKIQPDFLPAVGNMPIYAFDAGHEEEALNGFQRSAAAYAAGAPDYTRDYADGFALDARSTVADLKGDYGASAKFAEQAETHGGGPVIEAERPFATAAAYADAHDFAAARQAMARNGLVNPARLAAAEHLSGPQFDLPMLFAIATDDEAAKVAGYGRFIAALSGGQAKDDSLKEQGDFSAASANARARLAIALARLGRIDEARAALAGLPDDHDPALRARALVAAYSGDARGSDALFARASARTPSLSAAPLLWAEALLHRGDAARAESQAREAIRRGPNSAAAERMLGDALMAERRFTDATGAYASAARLAPQWGALQMRWASALWRAGKHDEARARLRAAASMTLSPADAAHLRSMWARARA